jgi:putative ABC transport system permease protein
MRIDIRHVAAALRRHRMATVLIGLQIALACAVLCNSLFLLSNRLHLMSMVSGVDERNLIAISLQGSSDDLGRDTLLRVKQALRGIASVESVSMTNAVPFTQQAGENGFRSVIDDPRYNQQGHFYVADNDFIHTTGLHLVAGRWLGEDETSKSASFLPSSSSILMSRSYAQRVWPGQPSLGQVLFADGAQRRVVGLIDDLARPNPEPLALDNTFLLTGPDVLGDVFVLRTDPASRDRVLRQALDAVARVAPEVVIDQDYSGTLSELRDRYFASNRAMAGMLCGIIAAMLLVTALGIVGLASFWVQQRRRQIGIRRAIGARRSDILGYFQTENFLIVSGGIAAGMVLAFALNIVLMKLYEVPRLPLAYLPWGAVVLWILGQLAVLGPAIRAARVPPVVATRSV